MKRVIFVSGCFDILHGGHIEFFNQAKQLGDELVVSFASDRVLQQVKGKRSSLPEEHKKRLLENISCIDKVVIGDNVDHIDDGLDFIDHFVEIRPYALVVTEDDRFEKHKIGLCHSVGAEYIKLPKTLNYEKISTTDIINWIKAPKEVPLRVDFAGGWLDVPRYSREGAYIVNCSISPTVTLDNWKYEIGGGLGGSAGYACLSGKSSVECELDMGVGWQDPAVIQETGLCVWRSGHKPVLDVKVNPDFLINKLYLYWTGKNHNTPSLANQTRDYNNIMKAGSVATQAVYEKSFELLAEATKMSYHVQLDEGMDELPCFGELSKKYCGGGFGGYALYIFNNNVPSNFIRIQPYMKGIS